ncbi:MAG: hypothetical protein NC548_40040 [Lachnospiraceae bacterium]|nr:hypothetical protein [Lachnospiraceae bacterium]MCM1232960.1 hypothetical protein [Ruminococcus flavefaciens]
MPSVISFVISIKLKILPSLHSSIKMETRKLIRHYAGTVSYCKESFLPVYIIELNQEKLKWAQEKFGLESKFPCIAFWGQGKLYNQSSFNREGYINLFMVTSIMHEMSRFMAIQHDDIKAWKLIQLYESLQR